MLEWIAEADGASDWTQAHVVVAGLGRSGMASADALCDRGAHVLVVDDSVADNVAERATLLEILGATVRTGPGASATLPENADLLIVSPGWRPNYPLLMQAAERGVPVWSEVELAWRLMHPDRVVPWIGITGTNGKTTTTQMVDAMLRADGYESTAVGNIGRPILEALADDTRYDVLAVELSSFQLHTTSTMSLLAGAVLNVHEDHFEWYTPTYGEHGAMAAYAADKARIYHNVQRACVYNVADAATEHMVEEADVIEGARAIGFTTGIPAPSQVGVVDDMIVDRAFVPERKTSALPLARVDDVHPLAPHNVENALAAAALARSFGVRPQAVTDGLRALHIGGHRIETVATKAGVRYVDDSKATNPHAANSSMRAFDSIVWIAGGQAKGTSFDDLVARHAEKLRGVVCLGVDRHVVADAVSRHAPDVPVVVLDSSDTGVMAQAVTEAARMARPGDVVLMAPGCASKDMWPGYAARGEDFAAAVEALGDDA